MASTDNPHQLRSSSFQRANLRCIRKTYDRWQRDRTQRYLLRSQLGFQRTDDDATAPQPAPCRHCIHYHGIAYGTSKARRSLLVCGFHPSGPGDGPCPDWSGIQD